jgi:hypothetical protein
MRIFFAVIFALLTFFVITFVNVLAFCLRLLFGRRTNDFFSQKQGRKTVDKNSVDEAEPVGILDDVTVIRDAEYEEVR